MLSIIFKLILSTLPTCYLIDGNGRIVRVMMNAELSAKRLSKIIIPTVYREDYMGALRKLTRQRVADAYVRMLK